MPRAWLSCGVAALTVVFAACRSVRSTNPETAARPANAIEAVMRLRTAFDRGNCESIFDNSSSGFRSARRRPEWIAGCQNLRKDLGELSDFQIRQNSVVTSYAVVAANGRLHTGGKYSLWTLWVQEDGGAKLAAFDLSRPGETVARWPPRRERPLIDRPTPYLELIDSPINAPLWPPGTKPSPPSSPATSGRPQTEIASPSKTPAACLRTRVRRTEIASRR